MKVLFLLALLSAVKSNAQGIISLPDMNVLYVGYPNKVAIGSGASKKKFLIIGENVILTGTSDKNVYNARVLATTSEAKIHIVSKKGHDTLRTYTYRVRTLPVPALSLGYSFEGDSITYKDSIIHVGYDKNVNFSDVTFEILSYQLIIQGEKFEYSSPGNTLSMTAQSALKNTIDKPKNVTLICKAKGPDGILRTMAANYILK